MTLLLDSWTDVSSNSNYGLILSFGYSKSNILENFDFSSERHTAKKFVVGSIKHCELQLHSLGQIKCCCTDSSSTMVKFCCLLNEKHKHIIVLPCALHALNLLAKNLCKFEDAMSNVKSNGMIVHFFTLSHVWFHNSKEWVKKNGSNGKCKYSLDSLCETKWYSMTKDCLGVNAYE